MAKEMKFGIKIAAALANGFESTFNKANQHLSGANENLRNYQKTWKAVYNAQKKGIISPKMANNAFEKMLLRAEKLPALEAKFSKYANGAVQSFANLSIAKDAFGFLVGLSAKAMEFESAMADVRKVVDFETPKQLKEMSKDILDLSTKIPMTAEGLAKIVEFGGQSGIAREDLTQFAESAAKMGIAFDVTADQAGEMMAKWRTAFKMNQSQVTELADKINYLGNTTAASAPLISDVVTRIGPLGDVGGVASGEIAAMGASLIGSGVSSEIAATGIKNLILGLNAGESATKKQAEAFAQLGLDSATMANRMQTDARGAILEVLSAINKLPKENQTSVLTQLFGKESVSAIAPLLSNLNGLKDNFKKVGDATQYAGSMQAEFAARSDTTANNMQLMQNRIAKAQIQMSSGLLPVVAEMSEVFGRAATQLGDFAERYPGLITGVVTLVAGLVGLYAAISFGMGVYNAYNAVLAAYQVIQAAAGNSAVWATAKEYALSAANGVATAAQWAFNAALAAFPGTWIVAAIVAVIAAGVLLYNNWDTVKAKVTEAIDSIMSKLRGFVDWIAPAWDKVASILSKPIIGNVQFASTGAGPVMANATGGIYGKGAFLTTFAEESGESAIPHTPNRRNIGLLARTNEIMGNPLGGGGSINATFAPNISISGSTDVDAIDGLMQDKMREFEAMLQRVASQNRRLSYG